MYVDRRDVFILPLEELRGLSFQFTVYHQSQKNMQVGCFPCNIWVVRSTLKLMSALRMLTACTHVRRSSPSTVTDLLFDLHALLKSVLIPSERAPVGYPQVGYSFSWLEMGGSLPHVYALLCNVQSHHQGKVAIAASWCRIYKISDHVWKTLNRMRLWIFIWCHHQI